jgi:neutral ceramidase
MANVLIAATHSHTGPLFDDLREDYFHDQAVEATGKDPHKEVNYADLLADRFVEALTAADHSKQKAALELVKTSMQGVSFNRRYWMRDGTVKFNPGQLNLDIVKPAGPIDPEAITLFIQSLETKQKLGGLSVFACHPDTLGGTMYSGDYPYFLGKKLSTEFGPEFVSVFALGASGDVNHIDVTQNSPRKGADTANRLGDQLGESLLSSLIQPVDGETISLRVKSQVINIPLQAVNAREIEQAHKDISLLNSRDLTGEDFERVVRAVKTLELEQRGAVWPAEVQVFRISKDVSIVGLPGEIFAELGLHIKRESPFKNTIIVTLSNDRLSYIPTLKAFEEGSYEVTNSRVMPGAGEAIAEVAISLLNELSE